MPPDPIPPAAAVPATVPEVTADATLALAGKLTRGRRAGEVLAFVLLWTLAGKALALDANGYLLLGVPLTLLFQVLVRRQPLTALWVRAAPPFLLTRSCRALALLLAVYPVIMLVAAVGDRDWPGAGWAFAAIGGAMGAGYAAQHLGTGGRRELLRCALVIGAIGGIPAAAQCLEAHRFLHPAVAALSLLQYVPAVFVLEEVTFRGALDAHLHLPGETRPWSSALFVSALWGFWHWPIAPDANPLALLLVHSLVGVPLAFFWRRSGNLMVPAFAHALIDALRNAAPAPV